MCTNMLIDDTLSPYGVLIIECMWGLMNAKHFRCEQQAVVSALSPHCFSANKSTSRRNGSLRLVFLSSSLSLPSCYWCHVILDTVTR